MDSSVFIEGKKQAPASLGRVLVLGLGKSGKSAARYCASLLGSRVSSLYIAAGARNADSEAFCESLACEGVAYAFGDDALSPDVRANKGIPAEARSAHPEDSELALDGESHGCEVSVGALSERPGDSGQVPNNQNLFDLCIASPGIPFWNDLYVAGQTLSAELISEVEFAWRESDAASTWVAITGTNGKTTTTALTAHLLRECGLAAHAVGNIGDVCLDAVIAGETSVYVAEVSSYQLASTRSFAPDVAVELNITPDHIHWHRTLEAYRDAKFSLLDHMTDANTPASVAILDATNDVVRSKVRELKALSRDERGFDYVPLGTADGISGDMRARCGSENAAFLDGEGRLHVGLRGVDHVFCSADDLLIKGEHNVSNAIAAASVAVALGADDEAISRALTSFEPLEHRIEPCGSVAGVECYNDSKATNVDAVVKALEAFPGKRLYILLGGDDKGTDLSELVESVRAHATSAVCFGEAGPRFANELKAVGFNVVRAAHLDDALDAALQLASEGDVLLLSPACASFDEFTSFEERGRVFKQLVADRAKGV